MSLFRKFAVILVLISLMVLSLAGCKQKSEEQSTVEPTSSSTPQPQPTATPKPETTPEIINTSTPTASPPSVPSPTQEGGATNTSTETEIPDTTSQSIPDNFDPSNANFSVIDGPSPINVKQQLSSFGGGGGGRRDIPNNCLSNHFGITYYDEPVMVEGLMSTSHTSRTLQIPQKPSIWFEELPDVCACGFKENEEVTLKIVNPMEEVVFERQFSAGAITGTNGEFIVGAYCIESNVISEFDFWPGDPIGLYTVMAESDSGTTSYEFELGETNNPYFYYSNRAGGYILGGLKPHEVIVAAFYEVTDAASGTFSLVQDVTIETDDYGVAFLERGNTLVGESWGEDSELLAPIAIFRGDPTTENFEISTFYESFITPTGFVIFSPEVDFSGLIEQNPDNPYLYFYQGDLEKFIEMAPNSEQAMIIKANDLLEQSKDKIESSAYNVNYFNRELSEEDLQFAVDLLNELIETSANPTKALTLRADAYAMLEEYELALADILEAARLNIDSSYFPFMEGNLYLLSGNYELAIDSFEKIVNIDPYSVRGYFEMGCLYHQLSNHEQATEFFLRDIEAGLHFANLVNEGSFPRDIPLENYYSYLAGGDINFGEDLCIDEYNSLRTDYFLQISPSFDLSSYRASHPVDNMEILYVPAGEFIMGSLPEDNRAEPIEYPQHIVHLDSYWIDSQEVSANQYALCVNAGVCNPPTEGNLDEISVWDNAPITYVTWADASSYCNWVGRRLPTEAEWEKAARGLDARIYPWGNSSPNVCGTNVNYDSDGVRALYYESVNYSCVAPSGAIDMAGNAWEWVADYFGADYYANSPSENPQGPETGNERVVRGGSWTTSNINFLRTANRWSRPEDFSSDAIGFRCALSANP
ncbi:MAG: SUMF1/EgtB/PvdO family nonheme iron enzyme [Ardenticatenaceae bacterium]|nr:SUMF1/EgtB/PvdO family nonheme iron enzyme [Ardenticatenaceae bacterium]